MHIHLVIESCWFYLDIFSFYSVCVCFKPMFIKTLQMPVLNIIHALVHIKLTTTLWIVIIISILKTGKLRHKEVGKLAGVQPASNSGNWESILATNIWQGNKEYSMKKRWKMEKRWRERKKMEKILVSSFNDAGKTGYSQAKKVKVDTIPLKKKKITWNGLKT